MVEQKYDTKHAPLGNDKKHSEQPTATVTRDNSDKFGPSTANEKQVVPLVHHVESGGRNTSSVGQNEPAGHSIRESREVSIDRERQPQQQPYHFQRPQFFDHKQSYPSYGAHRPRQWNHPQSRPANQQQSFATSQWYGGGVGSGYQQYHGDQNAAVSSAYVDPQHSYKHGPMVAHTNAPPTSISDHHLRKEYHHYGPSSKAGGTKTLLLPAQHVASTEVTNTSVPPPLPPSTTTGIVAPPSGEAVSAPSTDETTAMYYSDIVVSVGPLASDTNGQSMSRPF